VVLKAFVKLSSDWCETGKVFRPVSVLLFCCYEVSWTHSVSRDSFCPSCNLSYYSEQVNKKRMKNTCLHATHLCTQSLIHTHGAVFNRNSLFFLSHAILLASRPFDPIITLEHLAVWTKHYFCLLQDHKLHLKGQSKSRSSTRAQLSGKLVAEVTVADIAPNHPVSSNKTVRATGLSGMGKAGYISPHS
jgi:hypothetical protein